MRFESLIRDIGTEIGFVASGSTAFAAPIVVSKKYEHLISDEQMLLHYSMEN